MQARQEASQGRGKKGKRQAREEASQGRGKPVKRQARRDQADVPHAACSARAIRSNTVNIIVFQDRS